MSQMTDTNTKTFVASAAIDQYALVTVDSNGEVAETASTEIPIGTATREAFADQDVIAVKLLSGTGTHKCIANGAFDAGALLYAVGDGEVDDAGAAGDLVVGVALEAAGAAGDIVEVLALPHIGVAET